MLGIEDLKTTMQPYIWRSLYIDGMIAVLFLGAMES